MSKSTKDLAYSEEHVLERALERYRLKLDAGDYRKLNEAVQRARNAMATLNEGPSEITKGQDDSEAEMKMGLGSVTLLNDERDEQIWGVGWAAQTLVCVWSTSLGRVTTLLPEGTVVTRRKGTKSGKGKR